MLRGQEAYVLKMSKVFMTTYHACMKLITSHLLIYGIVTRAGSRLGTTEVLKCWQKQGLVMSTKFFQMNASSSRF
jgi:hypothetical protein